MLRTNKLILQGFQHFHLTSAFHKFYDLVVDNSVHQEVHDHQQWMITSLRHRIPPLVFPDVHICPSRNSVFSMELMRKVTFVFLRLFIAFLNIISDNEDYMTEQFDCNIRIITTSCRSWNKNSQSWEGSSCTVSAI